MISVVGCSGSEGASCSASVEGHSSMSCLGGGGGVGEGGSRRG